jgi:gluconate:H+ symporter, GntP family
MNPFILLLVGVVVVVGGILVLRLHPFLALILGAFSVGILTTDQLLLDFAQQADLSPAQTTQLTGQSVGRRVATAFGDTAARVGILIAMASIIGGCLLKSGAAERIVRSSLRLFGEKKAPVALVSSSFTLAIPVFFDTVFYLMIPLVKALAIRTKRNYALYLMAVIAGGTMAHSLVPPTPGPLFVASVLNVNLGLMILGGLGVGVITVAAGYAYAVWANRRQVLPIREANEATLEELQAMSNKDEQNLPLLWVSLLPVLLPVLLIAGNTILQVTIGSGTELAKWEQNLLGFFASAGDSNLALTLSAGIALITLTYRIKDRPAIKKTILDSLSSGGVIILITGAGGAFGAILQQTNIGFHIKEMSSVYQIGLLPLAFMVTALVRTAQGSATVAMITAVGIIGGVAATPESLGFHPMYIALVIGCGSKLVPWMNDSGFWIICKMSGMTERETIKNFSVLLTIMGITGLFACMALAKILPLI